jgi:hypothetical protein
MHTFPSDFAELLSARGRHLLARRTRARSLMPRARSSKFVFREGLLDPAKARRCLALLDERLYTAMRLMQSKIPRDTISGMKRNYSERLPKAVLVKTSSFERPASSSARAAAELGLIEMLQSESLRKLGEALTGLALLPSPSCQALLYEDGYYSGPHNDHHPENECARDGFVDVHVTLANDAVEHQWLVYESSGHFSNIVKISRLGGISAYHLPFWHFTTPLVGRYGREHKARRWLLLATYTLARKRPSAGRGRRSPKR